MSSRSEHSRYRRTAGEIDRIRAAIFEILSAQHPVTCRGLFYALVARGQIAKTELEYKKTVLRLAAEMRRAGQIPYSWIADNSRWMRKPATWDSLEDALEETAQFYRRALWSEQDSYVEVWLEKEALSGLVYEVTQDWDVPLMVTRGYASLSFLHLAASHLREVEKPVFIYYLGDYDPSGVDIPRKIEAELRQMAPETDLTFRRLALNLEQVKQMGLPTRPTKPTDPRNRRFGRQSVEVDAIPAPVLRRLVQDAIASHIDPARLDALLEVERAERESLQEFTEGFRRTA